MKNKHIQIRISEDLYNKLKKKQKEGFNVSEEIRTFLNIKCHDSQKFCNDNNGHKTKKRLEKENDMLKDLLSRFNILDLHQLLNTIDNMNTLHIEREQEKQAEKILGGGK
jgi:predicted CopG family antitoxin